jgi:hypothetical protein
MADVTHSISGHRFIFFHAFIDGFEQTRLELVTDSGNAFNCPTNRPFAPRRLGSERRHSLARN